MSVASLRSAAAVLVAAAILTPVGPGASSASSSGVRATDRTDVVPASAASAGLPATTPAATGPALPPEPALRYPAGTGFRLPLPAPAVVLTGFVPPPTRYGRGHRGVDLAAAVGAVVRAAGAGTVVFAGGLAGRGVVSIRHPSGLRTTYEPVTTTVATGTTVAEGEPIGILTAGHQACAPASCLHWGARLPDGSYLDPLALLRPWQVRLLPWDRPP